MGALRQSNPCWKGKDVPILSIFIAKSATCFFCYHSATNDVLCWMVERVAQYSANP